MMNKVIRTMKMYSEKSKQYVYIYTEMRKDQELQREHHGVHLERTPSTTSLYPLHLPESIIIQNQEKL